MTQNTHPPYSRRPLQVWAAARADYEAGASIRIVAERHGLNIRTVSRHARSEGWKEPRVCAEELYRLALANREFDRTAVEEVAAVGHIADRDDEALLLRPDTLGLCRFAFRRAAECAGVAGPTEAMAWIRLAEATARLRRNVDVDVRPMSEADYRRVAAMNRLEVDAMFDALESAPPDEEVVPDLSETVP
jgi:predicted Zn-ribbon and HTH transcriptional regulator